MILPREGRAKPSRPVEPDDTNENEGPRPSFSGAKGFVKAPGMKGLWKNGIKYVRGNRSLQEPKNGSPAPPPRKLYALGKSSRSACFFASQKKHASFRDASLLMAEDVFFTAPSF